jgi:hypothetical protein
MIYSFKNVIRKWLKVEKKKFFSYNHLNNNHKKTDWTIRITFLVIMIISSIINFIRIDIEKIWFLETYVLLFVFIIVSETARAIMEWKYAENRNDYIFTIIQLIFISIFLFLTFTTNFFGLILKIVFSTKRVHFSKNEIIIFLLKH